MTAGRLGEPGVDLGSGAEEVMKSTRWLDWGRALRTQGPMGAADGVYEQRRPEGAAGEEGGRPGDGGSEIGGQ